MDKFKLLVLVGRNADQGIKQIERLLKNKHMHTKSSMMAITGQKI